ncbi:MAG: T9SS type A sorting domain-containing protein, partial [Bacteroidales bacterium]|nr:T9SS type A sorting domain-containing protein [Bacteroidales bacterium]
FETSEIEAVVFPNPFAETATVSINLTEMSSLSVKVYSATGALVSTLVNDSRAAGTHQFSIRLTEKGVYFAEVMVNNNRQVLKLVAR